MLRMFNYKNDSSTIDKTFNQRLQQQRLLDNG